MLLILRGTCRFPDKSKMEVCVSIVNSGKQRWKNVGDANYNIKPDGTMSMGFVDNNAFQFKETLDRL